MFRKKVQLLILSAAIAGTMALPVSAAETIAPIEASSEVMDEEIPSEEISSDDLTVTDEEGEGETGLPDGEQLGNVQEDSLGSISISLTEGKEGTSMEGVAFNCVKVADITNGEYVLTDTFASAGVDLNNLKNADEAAEAAKILAGASDIQGVSVSTDSEGKLVFSDLEVGVYLITAEDTETYDIVTPALVAIPSWSEEIKDMAYDLEVEPKHTEREDVTEEPGAPQTNVFSPIYLYFGGAVIVAVVAVTGNIIYRRRKNK